MSYRQLAATPLSVKVLPRNPPVVFGCLTGLPRRQMVFCIATISFAVRSFTELERTFLKRFSRSTTNGFMITRKHFSPTAVRSASVWPKRARHCGPHDPCSKTSKTSVRTSSSEAVKTRASTHSSESAESCEKRRAIGRCLFMSIRSTRRRLRRPPRRFVKQASGNRRSRPIVVASSALGRASRAGPSTRRCHVGSPFILSPNFAPALS